MRSYVLMQFEQAFPERKTFSGNDSFVNSLCSPLEEICETFKAHLVQRETQSAPVFDPEEGSRKHGLRSVNTKYFLGHAFVENSVSLVDGSRSTKIVFVKGYEDATLVNAFREVYGKTPVVTESEKEDI